MGNNSNNDTYHNLLFLEFPEVRLKIEKKL